MRKHLSHAVTKWPGKTIEKEYPYIKLEIRENRSLKVTLETEMTTKEFVDQGVNSYSEKLP